jgi:P-type conjugative transfer protein TrbJ
MEDQAKSSQNALEHLVRTVEDQKESLTGIEQKKLKELMGDASNADGQLKAIGSTNALLGNLAQQLMGMRSTQMAMLDTVIERGRAEDEVKARAAAVTQKLHGEPFEYKRKPAKKWTMF